jgi:phage terminase large subunit-like protein
MAPDRLAEQRRRLPESSFRRLFENVWTEGTDRLASADDLRACVTLEGPQDARPGVRYVVALDLGIRHDRTVATVQHAETVTDHEGAQVGARVVLDRIGVWQGSKAQPVSLELVEDWVFQAASSYRGARVVLDPWQAIGLAQRLRSRGLRVDEFTFSAQSVGRLASTLHLLIRNRALALPEDEELLAELANVRLRETSPGVLRLDHDPDKHDDRAVALALGAVALLEQPASSMAHVRYRPYGPGDEEPVTVRGDLILRGERYVDEVPRWDLETVLAEGARA